jgi:hypothetical protein
MCIRLVAGTSARIRMHPATKEWYPRYGCTVPRLEGECTHATGARPPEGRGCTAPKLRVHGPRATGALPPSYGCLVPEVRVHGPRDTGALPPSYGCMVPGPRVHGPRTTGAWSLRYGCMGPEIRVHCPQATGAKAPNFWYTDPGRWVLEPRPSDRTPTSGLQSPEGRGPRALPRNGLRRRVLSGFIPGNWCKAGRKNSERTKHQSKAAEPGVE